MKTSERVYNSKTVAAVLPEPNVSRRYWELDFLRGLCVILMMIDHFCYSAGSILPEVWATFGGEKFWQGLQQLAIIYWDHNLRRAAWLVVITTFFLICGISCTLSHNNAARGIKTFAVGLMITGATYLADAFFNLGVQIIFGVIHMLGCAILLFSLIDLIGWGLQKITGLIFKRGKAAKTSEWVRKLLPMAIGITGLIIYFTLPLGHFGKVPVTIHIDGEAVEFPAYIHLFSDISIDKGEGTLKFLSIFFELKDFKLSSSDYFPIIPYAFIVLIGSGIGRLVYGTKAKNFLRPLDGKWNKPVGFVGRRALIFYLLHQIVIVAFFFAMGGLYSIGN